MSGHSAKAALGSMPDVMQPLNNAALICFLLFCIFLVIGKRAHIGFVIGGACFAALQFGESAAAYFFAAVALTAMAADIIIPIGLKVTDVNHPRTENVLSAVRRAPAYVPPAIAEPSLAPQCQSAPTPSSFAQLQTSQSTPDTIDRSTPAAAEPSAASGAGDSSETPAETAGTPAAAAPPDLHADDSVLLPMSLPRAAPGSSDKHSFVALPNIVNKVRGVDYMVDSVKVQPEPPLFQCVNVDCFYCDSKTPGLLTNPANFYPKARAAGDERFYFIMHYATPPKPLMHMVMYFAVDPSRLDSSPEFARLWQKFLTGDDAWRNERLKIVPNVAEAPWAVRWAVGGSKPVLLARRLKHTYTIDPESKVVLVNCDVESSSWASGIVGTLRGNISHVVIDLGFTLEGRASNELPERIMGAGQLRYINLKNCGSLDK